MSKAKREEKAARKERAKIAMKLAAVEKALDKPYEYGAKIIPLPN